MFTYYDFEVVWLIRISADKICIPDAFSELYKLLKKYYIKHTLPSVKV